MRYSTKSPKLVPCPASPPLIPCAAWRHTKHGPGWVRPLPFLFSFLFQCRSATPGRRGNASPQRDLHSTSSNVRPTGLADAERRMLRVRWCSRGGIVYASVFGLLAELVIAPFARKACLSFLTAPCQWIGQSLGSTLRRTQLSSSTDQTPWSTRLAAIDCVSVPA